MTTEDLRARVSLHQGSILSYYLFTVIMDEVSKDIQGEIPWCIVFENVIFLIREYLVEDNNRLEKWRVGLEGDGLKISRSKSKYIQYELGRREQKVNGTKRAMTIGGDVISKIESFKYEYLEVFVQNNFNFDKDVKYRIKRG